MNEIQQAVVSAMLRYSNSLEWITYKEIRRFVPISIKKSEIMLALNQLEREGYLRMKNGWWGFNQ